MDRLAKHQQHRTPSYYCFRLILLSLALLLLQLLSYTIDNNDVYTLADAVSYTTSCSGSNLASVSAMVTKCNGLGGSIPACPHTAAESLATSNSMPAGVFATYSFFGGGVPTHSTDMIIWSWNLSPYRGVIFWVQPGKSAGGYAPGNAYDNWGGSNPPASTTNNQILGSYRSLLGGRGPWITMNLGSESCVTCQQQSCAEACPILALNSPVKTVTSPNPTNYNVWPNCICTCNPGWTGVACNRQIEVYPVPAGTTTMTQINAICEAVNGFVAQPKTRLEEDLILQVVPAAVAGGTDFRLPVVIGAYAKSTAHTYCYHDGPRVGQCVAVDGTTVAGQYSAYGTGVLSGAAPSTPLITALLPLSYQDSRWSTIAATAAKQVACEFATCAQACQSPGTASSTGDYPTCSCLCKNTHAGRFCHRLKTATMTLTVTLIVTLSEPITISLPMTLSEKISTSSSLPMTSSHPITTSLSLPKTPSASETSTHIETLSLPLTTTHSIPPSLSAAVTKSLTLQPTTTATRTIVTSTLSKTVPTTTTISLLITLSTSMPHTLSLPPTLTDPITMSVSKLKTQSLPPTASDPITMSVSNAVTGTGATPTTTSSESQSISNAVTGTGATPTTTSSLTRSTTLSAPTPTTSIADTVSKLELSQTGSLPPTPSITHTVSPRTTSNSRQKTHSEDVTPSVSIHPTSSGSISESTSRSADTPSLIPTSSRTTSPTDSIPNTPTRATPSRTRSAQISRPCPSVLATVFRTAVAGVTSDLTLLTKEAVSEEDLQQGLLVLNLTILEPSTTTTATTPPTTTFTFYSDVSLGNITLYNKKGPLNVTPSCTRASPKLLMCWVPHLPTYKILDEELIEIRASGNGVSPPCTEYPWSMDWLRTIVPSPKRAGSSAVTARSIAVAGLLLFDGTPIEIQVMTAMLNSACASDLDRDSVLIVRYFLSPFMHLGWYWVVIGNISLSVVFALLHTGVLMLIYVIRLHRTSTEIARKTGKGRQPVSPELRGEIMADASSYVLFPGIPLLVCHVLYIGVACATFDILRNNSGSDLAVSAVGFVFMLAIPAIDTYLLSQVMYVLYQDYEDDLGCQPRGRCLGWIYPKGVWGPRADVKRYFGLVGPYREGYRFLAAAPHGLALFTAVLFYAVSDFVTCRYTFIVITAVLVVIAVIKTLLLPRRSRILSLFTGVCLLAVAGISALNFFIDILNMTVNSYEVALVKQLLFAVAVGTAVIRTIISIIIFVGEIIWFRRKNENHELIVTNGYVLDEKCRVAISRPTSRAGGAHSSSGSGKDADPFSTTTSQKYSSSRPNSGDSIHICQLDKSHNHNSSTYSSQDDMKSRDDDGGRGGSISTTTGGGSQRNTKSVGGSLFFTSINEEDELYNLGDLTEINNTTRGHFVKQTPTPSASAFSKIRRRTQTGSSSRRRSQYEATNPDDLRSGPGGGGADFGVSWNLKDAVDNDDDESNNCPGGNGTASPPPRRISSFANSQYTYCGEAMGLVPRSRLKSLSSHGVGGTFGVPIGESYMERSDSAVFSSRHPSGYFGTTTSAGKNQHQNITTPTNRRRQTISFAVDADGLWLQNGKRNNNTRNTPPTTKDDWSSTSYKSGDDDNESYFCGGSTGRDVTGGGDVYHHSVPSIINNIDMVPPRSSHDDDASPFTTPQTGGGIAASSSSSPGILRLANRPDLLLSSNRLPAAVVLSEILSTSGGSGVGGGGECVDTNNNRPNSNRPPREYSNISTASSVLSCTATVITPRTLHLSGNGSHQMQLEEDRDIEPESNFWSDFANNKF